ncbi:DNA utilization protein GntX [Enterobacter sp.]|uniref:DNA utilization protein GntX n=1 Tax=Enterobacter sp. TaxID=42895 RepID=UPI00296FE8DB|nr:DNA utilization protein GntX [Enterobacter sp.]
MLTAPGLCWLCRMPLVLARWGICSVCTQALKMQINVCPQCGLPATCGVFPCGRCLQKPPPWQALVAVNDYLPPLSTLIHRLKFLRQPDIAGALARLLLLAAQNARRQQGHPWPDRLIAVPLATRRQWQRGFNQSDLLCRPLARWLGCEYDPCAIKRIRATPVQHHLRARLRRQNVKNAFRLELPVRGLHIAIVDDVVTTGSTAAEIAHLLLRSGAATVQVWCLCRTL